MNRIALTKRSVTYVLAAVVVLIFIVPMLLVLLNSFKSASEAATFDFSLPKEWLFSNYGEVFRDPTVLRSFANSIIISVSVTGGTVLVCSMAAYVIARRFSRITTGVYSYLIAGMIAPFAFIPAIKVLQSIGLYNTHLGLILVDIATQIPYITLIFVAFIRQTPKELDEAAVLDGCGPIRLFFRVIFPLLKPVTFTAVILVFTYAWNEFQNILFLTSGSDVWTLPMMVYNFQSLHTYNYALVSANLMVTMLPVLLVYLFVQKFIMSGLTTGAVKG